MAAYVFPRRKPSIPTTITIGTPAPELPSWVPPAGLATSYFNNVTRADTGAVMLGQAINPDYYAEDGSATPYPLLFFASSGFIGMWNAQAGGAYAANLGALGSIMLYSGGHDLWDGPCLLRFDIATGVWSHHFFPPYTAVSKSIDGGTVALLTGTVTSRDSLDDENSNDRVNTAGSYCKYADDTPIPGTDLDPDLCTVWIPYPIHSNAGIHIVPPSGGGGPNGTLVLIMHEQTSLYIPNSEHSVYLMDLSGNVWERWKVQLATAHTYPGLEWDSGNNLMWYIPVSGNLSTLKFPGREKHTTGFSINQSSSYCANACYVPSRRMMVTMMTSGPAQYYSRSTAPSSDSFTTPINISNTSLSRVFNVGCNVSGGTDVTLQRSTTSATGPWTDVATFTVDTDTEYDTTPDRLLGTLLWYRIGIKFGNYGGATTAYIWSRRVNLLGWKTDAYTFGNDSWSPVTGTLLNTQDFWTEWPKDHGSMMHGIGTSSSNPHQVQDRLMYCEYDDCLFFLDRPDSARPSFLNFWRLRPPPIGQEFTGAWTWEKEVIQDGTPTHEGAGFTSPTRLTHLAGRSQYVPAIKSVIYTDSHVLPVQVLRSKTWV